MKFGNAETIIKSLKNKEDAIDYLETYYKDNKTIDNPLTSELLGELSDLRTDINDLYEETLFENLIEKDEIKQKNTIFEENKLNGNFSSMRRRGSGRRWAPLRFFSGRIAAP